MSDQSKLRFDIYERVHLSDDTMGIQELEQVELVPQIEVEVQDENAVLKGSLLLKGVYKSEDRSDEPGLLEYAIPVEITLPKQRIYDMDNIGIEIDDFDVDLLSKRSLNVTGVMMLTGVEAGNSAAESWKEDEEMVFIHQAAEVQAMPGEPTATDFIEAASTMPELAPAPAPLEQAAVSAVVASDNAVQAVTYGEDYIPGSEYAPLPGDNALQTSLMPAELEIAQVELPSAPKIAIAGKKASDSDSAIDTAGFKKLMTLHSDVRTEAAEPQQLQQQAAKEARIAQAVDDDHADQASSDALEWKRLFLSTRSEESAFRKVRMCIVQRDETVESIAERYQISPRAIILRNGIGDHGVSEGQVIYIPS